MVPRAHIRRFVFPVAGDLSPAQFCAFCQGYALRKTSVAFFRAREKWLVKTSRTDTFVSHYISLSRFLFFFPHAAIVIDSAIARALIEDEDWFCRLHRYRSAKSMPYLGVVLSLLLRLSRRWRRRRRRSRGNFELRPRRFEGPRGSHSQQDTCGKKAHAVFTLTPA